MTSKLGAVFRKGAQDALTFLKLADLPRKSDAATPLDVEDATKSNDAFRRVLRTGPHEQLVAMSIPPGQDIGSERHPGVDQFLRVEEGRGRADVGGRPSPLQDGSAFIVPAGTQHNVTNVGEDPLKLYTVYSRPEHAEDTVEHDKRASLSMDPWRSPMRRKLETMYGFEPFTLDTHALRREPRDAPGKGETSPTVGPAPVQGSC